MANITIVFGTLLIILGVVGYFGTGGESVTALIPAFFGIVLGLLGALARNEKYLKHSMHAAAIVGVLGFLGSASGLLQLPALFGGGGVERPAAVVAQSAMAILMLIFVALCIKSFVDARRARNQQGV